MGVIYRARDPSLDRQVAVKCVRPSRRSSSLPRARERLMREAQALAQLSHPNVVAVYDVGVSGDDVFIAMELVAGQSLKSWLAERPSIAAIRTAFLAAGAGLAAAHKAGLVHRDFKPDNVVIGADGRARVIDFGLARPPSGSSDDASSHDDESGDNAPSTKSCLRRRVTHGRRRR
jgi:serine/threonine protein kinase